jgi:hypothetical protein
MQMSDLDVTNAISTAGLLQGLRSLEGAGWANLDARELAEILRKFHIGPPTTIARVRPDGGTGQGLPIRLVFRGVGSLPPR